MTYLHKVSQMLKCGDFVLCVTNVSREFVQGCALHTLGWLNCDRTKHVFSINSREYERASSRMASTKGCIKLKLHHAWIDASNAHVQLRDLHRTIR
jgi:hypothetical protein